MALPNLIMGTWLTVNDKDETRCHEQFIGGNVNLSLICALLFTTYLPLMYQEVSRINIPDDGLTIDIFDGYVNSLHPIKMSKDQIHDFFDVCYLMAVAGTLFGTMVSVFYMLAANEAGTDRKTFVLLKYLGTIPSVVPYYFFTIGTVSWAFGAYLQLTLVARTSIGFWIKEAVLGAAISVMLLVCFTRMVQGTFAGKVEENLNPPTFLDDTIISKKLDEFFADPYRNGDFTLKEFIKSLTVVRPSGYRVPLNVITEVKATSAYYRRLADVTGVSIEEAKEIANNCVS